MKFITTALLLTLSCALFAQNDAIDKLNNHFSGKYRFTWKKKSIRIDFMKSGEIFRSESFLRSGDRLGKDEIHQRR